MSNLDALPIACTLTPADFRARLGAIRRLNREALRGYERDGLRLAIRYAPDAIEQVRAMVAAEQRCCAFLDVEVREHADAVHVTLTAPPHARAAADALFEQFIAPVEADR